MSDRHPFLDLADHYYAVAADMERNAKQQMDIAELLSRHADSLCEQAMREAPSSEAEPKL